MATVVNNPAPSSESSGMNFMMGMVLLVVVVVFIVFWGIPMLRSTNVEQVTPQINVPDKIDVNVNQPNTQPSQK